ncbi:MAG: hypothetical protein ACYDAK_05745 [Candidatus Limnocylindrales bacterium]
MDDPRWEAGMPVLDRQTGRDPSSGPGPVEPPIAGIAGRPTLAQLPIRSVPETAPTPLQPYYINLSVIALIAGAIAITALELGAGPGSALVKLCVVVGAPILALTTGDATLRIWRSARAWMPVDRTKGWFRIGWVGASIVLIAVLVGFSWWVLTS